MTVIALHVECLYIYTFVKNRNKDRFDKRVSSFIQLVCTCLGSLATLQKVTVSFVMSVRPSASVEQLGSYWTDFHEI
jgi:hypothetical protein